MTKAAAADPHMRATVRKLIADTLGSKPSHIRHEAAGLSNLVYSVEHDSGHFVVRLNPEPEKLSAFRKGQWAAARAAEAGVPVPVVIHVGGSPMPHMILHREAGEPATLHPDRSRILHQLGRYAAVVNSIRTPAFGTSFHCDDGDAPVRPDWREFLRTELKLAERLRILSVHRMLPDRRLARIRKILEGAYGRGRTPALNHGDLRLKNVLVDSKGEISAILDWEDCISSLAPEWELSLALHDLSIDEKQVFLRGYGIRPGDIRAIAPVMKALNVVNYTAEVERLVRERKKTELEFCRVRLSGALDLYCV